MRAGVLVRTRSASTAPWVCLPSFLVGHSSLLRSIVPAPLYWSSAKPAKYKTSITSKTDIVLQRDLGELRVIHGRALTWPPPAGVELLPLEHSSRFCLSTSPASISSISSFASSIILKIAFCLNDEPVENSDWCLDCPGISFLET